LRHENHYETLGRVWKFQKNPERSIFLERLSVRSEYV
jgi:hypothetical protein